MFKFLFGGKKEVEVIVRESDRDRFQRLIDELNGIVDQLPVKPKVTLDPATGHVSYEMPEQFQDEALALPKPEASAAPRTEPAALEKPDTAPEVAEKPAA